MLYIAEVLHFLRAVNCDGGMLRLAVCRLYAASYGLSIMCATRDIMAASLQSTQPLPVVAVDISSLDTKLVTAKENNKLYGMAYGNTSGMG